MRTVFIFATAAEAEASLVTLSAVQVGEGRYHFFGGEIVICGMGLAAATQTAFSLGYANVRWINLGIAGCFGDPLPIGTEVAVDSVSLLAPGHDCPLIRVERRSPGEPAPPLYTSSMPLHRQPFPWEGAALVDMEGYAIARVAAFRHLPLSITKIVSDHCSSASSRVIRQRLPELSAQLAELAQRLAVHPWGPAAALADYGWVVRQWDDADLALLGHAVACRTE